MIAEYPVINHHNALTLLRPESKTGFVTGSSYTHGVPVAPKPLIGHCLESRITVQEANQTKSDA